VRSNGRHLAVVMVLPRPVDVELPLAAEANGRVTVALSDLPGSAIDRGAERGRGAVSANLDRGTAPPRGPGHFLDLMAPIFFDETTGRTHVHA
jgi:hypothetical protein